MPSDTFCIFATRDGFRVERILIQRSLLRPPIEVLRVTWCGNFLRDCTSIAEEVAAPHHSVTTPPIPRRPIWTPTARRDRLMSPAQS